MNDTVWDPFGRPYVDFGDTCTQAPSMLEATWALAFLAFVAAVIWWGFAK